MRDFFNKWTRQNQKDRGEPGIDLEKESVSYWVKVSYGDRGVETKVENVTFSQLNINIDSLKQKFLLDYANENPGTQLSLNDLTVTATPADETKNLSDLM